ncbi:MAG: zf-TFIIB domain-containing protein [Candidatus Omnitrophota bacterium]
MANCKNCGAALPSGQLVCAYCNSRCDVDLDEIHRYTVALPESDRICPRCNKPLQTIDLKLDHKFLIERCNQCMGLFFDPGELETLIERNVTNVHWVDLNRIGILQSSKRSIDYPVMYIKCPVCRKLMQRFNFGVQCGVIADKCGSHGIWLDGGELRQILEWTKAGGRILDEKKKLEEERYRLEQEKEKLKQTLPPYDPMLEEYRYSVRANENVNDNLFDKMAGVIVKLFGS